MRYFILIAVLSVIEGFYRAAVERFGPNVWAGIKEYREERRRDREGIIEPVGSDVEQWWFPDPLSDPSARALPAPESEPPPHAEWSLDEVLALEREIRERLRE